MKKQEMMNLLFALLHEALSETDFRLKRSDDGFVRKILGGRQVLGVPLWDYNPQFEFSLNICIRLDQVEEIFHRFSGSPAKYHAMSFTTITRLEYFTGDSGRYRVVTAEDVAAVRTPLSSVIRNKIIPFFNEHTDVSALDRSVNSLQPGIDVTQNPSGAMNAVILAHLAGHRNLDSLVAKHRTDMELQPQAPHAYNRLVEYLESVR
jgi:hypothetical protein